MAERITTRCAFEATYKLQSGQTSTLIDIPASSIGASWAVAVLEAVTFGDAIKGVLVGISIASCEAWAEHREARLPFED
jgi:hypothetical protein